MRAIVIAFLGINLLLSSCGNSGQPDPRLNDSPVLSARLQAETTIQIDFARHIKPILEERCVWCHNGKNEATDYALTNCAEAFKNQQIIPNKPRQSPLYQAAAGKHSKLEIPETKVKIASGDLIALKNWISSGAVWPEGPAGDLDSK